MKDVLRNNGLAITMFLLFFFSLGGQTFTGFAEYNEDQKEHQQQEVGLGEYLGSGHFIEAVFENWESEFLQMGSYVLLTVFLFQKGSSESKDPDKSSEPVDEDPRKAKKKKDTPGPVKKGGLALVLYENSLTIVLFLLFVMSFLLHAWGGSIEYNEEQLAHGQQETVSLLGYIGTSRFWFESFQNWQSEFMSVGALIVLSIFLRQKGSPESKPVAASNMDTGA
jgi:hypothetical protein